MGERFDWKAAAQTESVRYEISKDTIVAEVERQLVAKIAEDIVARTLAAYTGKGKASVY